MKLAKIILFIIATILLCQTCTEDDLGEGYASLFLSLVIYMIAFGLETV